MACKFVINQKQLFFSANVKYHMEICKDNKETIGGGWWHWDKRERKVYLYGESSDFGDVTKEQIIEAWDNSFIHPDWEGCQIIYSPYLTIHDVIKNLDKQEVLPIKY